MSKTVSRSPFTLQRWGILLACNLLNFTLISSAIAETELLKTLIVTGNGVESIETTIAEVKLGVEIEGKTVEVVQQEIARRSSKIVDLLRSRDVEKLKTTGVRLEPNYDREPNGNRRGIIGYTGTNIVSFQIAQDSVGSLLDEAVAAGASRIDGISFTATDEAQSEAKDEALRKASINAQNKAKVVLEALDLTANEIVNIEVDRANIESPRPFARGEYSASTALDSTLIIGGEQEVNAAVTLQISY